MVPPPEFTPVGKLIKNSRPLELDYHAGQDLMYDIKQTGRELENSPIAIPAYREVKMGSIALLNELYQPKGENKLWVNFSEDNEGRRNAVIQMLWGSQLTQFRPTLSHDKWDVQTRGGGTKNKPILNTDLVAVIDSKLRRKGVFNSITDSSHFNAMTIPYLINDRLYDDAREKEKRLVYTTDESIIQGLAKVAFRPGTPFLTPEYLASVNTYLVVDEAKGKATHQLVTSSTYDIGDPQDTHGPKKVKKEYGYTIETPRQGYTKSGGYVAMASKDGLSREQVEVYARKDQERNEPIYSLQLGLDALRVAHRLRKLT